MHRTPICGDRKWQGDLRPDFFNGRNEAARWARAGAIGASQGKRDWRQWRQGCGGVRSLCEVNGCCECRLHIGRTTMDAMASLHRNTRDKAHRRIRTRRCTAQAGAAGSDARRAGSAVCCAGNLGIRNQDQAARPRRGASPALRVSMSPQYKTFLASGKSTLALVTRTTPVLTNGATFLPSMTLISVFTPSAPIE